MLNLRLQSHTGMYTLAVFAVASAKVKHSVWMQLKELRSGALQPGTYAGRSRLQMVLYILRLLGIHRGGISMSGDGHIIPNHELVLAKGFRGIQLEAQEHLKDPKINSEQRDFYHAVSIALEAAINFARRYADLAESMAQIEKDALRKAELERIAAINRRIMEGRAESFHEALQVVYYCHLIMMIETNGHSFSFGRFDQYTYPYYKMDKVCI